jgi:photosystem II stability/assembly factor-like uncharacterized protein
VIDNLKLMPGLSSKIPKAITLIILLSIFVSNNSYSQPSWVWQAPAPTGNTLQSIKFVDVQTGYSCGNVGVILKTTNGGQNWIALPTPKNRNYNGIDFINATTGVAVGDSSAIIRTTNGGISWNVITPPIINRHLWSVDFATADTGYIAGNNGTVWKTINGGVSWTAQSAPNTFLFIVKFLDANHGVIGGRQTVLLTTNGGINWVNQTLTFTPGNNVTGVAYPNPELILATAHSENVIFRTSNGGINWNKYTLNIPSYHGNTDFAADMSFVNYNIGFMITSFVGNILKTTNSGMNWTQDSSYRLGKWYDIQMVNANIGYICGTGGTILQTTNSGLTWNTQLGTLRGINHNYFINQNTGFCAGDSGIILKTTNSGDNWITKITNTRRKLNSIHFVNDNTGYCAGDTGMVLKTVDCGENWISLNTKIPMGLNSIHFIDNNTGITVGDNSTILRTTNGGINWMFQYVEVFGDYSSVQMVTSQICFASSSIEVYKSTNGGVNWFTLGAYPHTGGNDLYFLDSLNGYSCEGQSRIRKTTNGGINWILQNGGGGLRNLRSIYFSDINNGIAVGDEGIITKTTNGGINWQRLQDFTNNYLTSVYFTDPNTGYITGHYGTLLKTTNGGLSFISHTASTEISDYKLYQNYPNPFNPSTIIKYELPEKGHAVLKVFDITGKKITELVNATQPAGAYEVLFDAAALPSGIYFYSLITGKKTLSGRMVLVK